MKNGEFGHNPGSTPEAVRDSLIVAAEFRLAEAFRKQKEEAYSVFFQQGTDPDTGEYIVWYRLGEEPYLDKPGIELIDVGVVMDRAEDNRAELYSFNFVSSEPHFYVKRPYVDKRPLLISARNSLQVTKPRRHRSRRGMSATPISDLYRKLWDYDLRQIKVRTESETDS